MPQPVEFINISATPDGLDQATRRKARSDAMRAYRRKQRNALELKQLEEERRNAAALNAVTPPEVRSGSEVASSSAGNSPGSSRGTRRDSPVDDGANGVSVVAEKENKGDPESKKADRSTVETSDLKRKKLLAYARKYGASAVAAAVASSIPRKPNQLGHIFMEGNIDVAQVGRWFHGMSTLSPAGIVSSSVTHLIVNTMWSGAQSKPVLMNTCISNAALAKAQITGQGLDDDFFVGKVRCIQSTQQEISKHGKDVDGTILIVIATLALLELLTGDPAVAVLHYQGAKQMAATTALNADMWLLAGWAVARLALVLGQDPVRIRCSSDVPPLAMCPHLALSKDTLQQAEAMAQNNAKNVPNSTDESDELPRHEFYILFRGLHRLRAVHQDSSLHSNPHILGGHQASCEYDLARIRYRIFRIPAPTSLHHAMEMVVSAAELHQSLPPPQSPVCLRLVSRTTAILLTPEQNWIKIWIGLAGDLSGLLWITATIIAFEYDEAEIGYDLLVYGLLNRLSVRTFEGFLKKMREWPWFVEEFSTNRSARVWAKVERGVTQRKSPP